MAQCGLCSLVLITSIEIEILGGLCGAHIHVYYLSIIIIHYYIITVEAFMIYCRSIRTPRAVLQRWTYIFIFSTIRVGNNNIVKLAWRSA